MLLEWLLAIEVPVPEERVPTPVVELAWQAPPECPTADDVLAVVTKLVEAPLGQDPSRRLHVEGVVTHDDDGYAIALSLASGTDSSQRTFQTASCDELLEPVGVVVALAVDPHIDAMPLHDEPPPPEPTTIPAPIPPEPIDPSPVRAVAPAAKRRDPIRAVLGVRGGIDGGQLPGVGGVLVGSLGVSRRRARAELGALQLFERGRARERASGIGGAFRVTAATIRGCAELGPVRVRVPVCGGAEVGAIRGRGFGPIRHDTVHKLWLALVAGAGVVWLPVPRVGIGLHAELVIAPFRREFLLDGTRLFVTRVAGGRALLTLETRLP
jgi:hypothetical protein